MSSHPTWLALAAALAVGCGGTTFAADDAGGSDAGSSDGSSDGGLSPRCPSTAPAGGASCSPEGLQCEYGSSTSLACNTVATCQQGAWTVSTPPPGPCPDPALDGGDKCPATFASVPVGERCSADYETFCDYPQGSCGCTVASGGPLPLDASAEARWYCDSPAQGCPLPRPKLGSTCGHEGLQCDYSPCVLPSGASIVCDGGTWREQPFGCAL